MNVPILLNHVRNASGIVVRVRTEVEFLHPVELLLVFDSSLV